MKHIRLSLSLCAALLSGCDLEDLPGAKGAGSDGTTDAAFEGDQAGECTDGADNDRDGLYDCDDPDCAGSPDCQDGGSGGEGSGGEGSGGEGSGGEGSGGEGSGGEGSGGEGSGGEGSGGEGSGGEGTVEGEDADGDGYIAAADGGDDCDDTDATVHPGAAETWYDGIDSDCAGDSDYDADGDSVDSDAHGGEDCDDTEATTYPGATETWYDGIDSDCAGDSDYDADADSFESDAHGGTDCDDTDATVAPGLYDRPNDSIDQDCDGADRELDGVVVDAGATTTEVESVGSSASASSIDVAVLVDTTGSMGSTLLNLDFAAIDAGLSTSYGDVHYGLASYDDYAYEPYGYPSGGDLPFILYQQITDDVSSVDTALSGVGLHYGGDGPESAMEALYQLLTGTGYDQDCDGSFDSTTDVAPFIESSSDPFSGAEVGPYDSTTSGGGNVGGIGFRSTALPIVVYITDYDLRDPDNGYSSPGGCPADAGSLDVETAAGDLGAFLVGIQVNNYTTTPYTQMVDLATNTGSLADTDGDGAYDDPLAYSVASASLLNTTIIDAINDIDGAIIAREYDEVWIEASTDPYGLVSSISPSTYTSVVATDWPLDFDITWTGSLPAVATAQTVTVSFSVYGDSAVIGNFDVLVEIPPL